MNRIVFGLALLAAMLLSGCWMGHDLYSATDAKPALPAGTYRLIETEEQDRVARVSVQQDGLTKIKIEGEKDSIFGLVPLGAEARTSIAWSSLNDDQPGEPNQVYHFVERHPDGRIDFYLPECEGEQAQIAREAGAMVETAPGPVCRFPSRTSLESAMRRLKPRREQIAISMVRTGD